MDSTRCGMPNLGQTFRSAGGLVPSFRVLTILLVLTLAGLAHAQGPSPITAQQCPPPALLKPLNPFGAPGSACGPVGSNIVPISSGLLAPFLPSIPNLEFGFLYSFGPNVKSGRLTGDYLLPISLRCDSALFVEAHVESEFQEFLGGSRRFTTAGQGFVTTTTTIDNRTDLSFGGGYRRLLRGGWGLVGVNAFYDTTRLWEKWYSGGGVGLELFCNVTPQDSVDLQANWYGNLFSRDLFVNAFRNKGGSYDIEAGYNRGIFNECMDLRLKFTGYQFDIGEPIYGYRAGAELTTRDGVLTARYEHGYDQVNGQYDTVGGFVTLGFHLDNILRLESPFTMPEPVFVNPRNLRRWLSQKVRRNWHQPTAVVLTRTGAAQTGQAGQACDRFLASVAVPRLFVNTYSSPIYPFTPFPWTSLDPTKFIVVEFDYAFTSDPGSPAVWSVGVGNSTLAVFNSFGGAAPTGQSGRMTFTLNTLGPNQGAFTTAQVDPVIIRFTVFTVNDVASLQVTNVCIRFNQ